MKSPISAVALILMYFLAFWRNGVLHYYKRGEGPKAYSKEERE
jgi:hypothetical protein